MLIFLSEMYKNIISLYHLMPYTLGSQHSVPYAMFYALCSMHYALRHALCSVHYALYAMLYALHSTHPPLFLDMSYMECILHPVF